MRTQEGEERARAAVQRQGARDQATWEKRLLDLDNQTFCDKSRFCDAHT